MPSATAQHATVPKAYQHGPSPAQLLAAAKHVTAHKSGSGLPHWYTVRPGDTLSSIAGHLYHNSSAWPALYWHNRSHIRWANVITAGQQLRVPREPAHIPAAPKQLAPTPAHTTVHYTPRHASPAATEQPQTQPAAATSTATWNGSYPGGAFGACVVSRESGGNPQVMNSSGHYGLYQFAESTWVAYGGNAADFGHASVGEQNQVFANALAQGGESNWSPYDGC